MSYPTGRVHALLAAFTLAATPSLALAFGGSTAVGEDPGLVLVPFLPGEVRVPRTVEVALLVYNPDPAAGSVALERLEVVADGLVIHVEELGGASLVGDPRYGEINALVERLPREITELNRDRRYFAPKGAPEFIGVEVPEARREIAVRLDRLVDEYDSGCPIPFRQWSFPLHYDQLFFDDAVPGTRARLELRVRYRSVGGRAAAATTTEIVTLLPAPLPPPGSLASRAGAIHIHAGDLHVHSCHGEAVNACAPSDDCAAESFQTSGDFTYAELRTHYEALGYDWFTATDHSYCINDTAEYQAIEAECAAITDTSFLCCADIELSSDEEGPQSGSDLGDAACLWTTSANHMGAHDITSRIPGGDEGFLGFCDGLFGDALAGFLGNIATIRAQGGYPIANHPAAGEFGWNSYDATVGIEAGGLQGVEIWNGETQSGQGGHVGQWVDWLLDGRLLYAYSGSDTHDEAFAFGANHVVLEANEVFDLPTLHAALKGGRSYVSNGPVLIMEVGLGGGSVPMGAMHVLPDGAPAAPIAPRVHYNFGTGSGVISIFAGRADDSAETLLCQSGSLTGEGVFECAATLETAVDSWYRGYSENGSTVAYTNPVFLLVGGPDPRSYCLGKENSAGCFESIGFNGVASATSGQPFEVTATEVLSGQFGLLFYGYAPKFVPWQDGTLCVAPPFIRTTVQNSGGSGTGTDCTGTYSFDFNAYIASGIDAGLVAGATVYAQYWHRDIPAASSTGMTDALQFTVGP